MKKTFGKIQFSKFNHCKNIFLFALSFLLFSSIFFLNPLTVSSSADSGPSISVLAKNNKGGTVDESIKSNIQTSFPSADSSLQDISSIYWKNIEYFDIGTTIPAVDENDEPFDSFKAELLWTPALIENNTLSFASSHTISETIFEKDITTDNTIPNIRLYIDEDISLTNSTYYHASDLLGETFENHGAYGSYCFVFSFIKGNEIPQTTYKLFEVLPTDISTIEKSFDIIKKIQGSKYLLENAYLFSLENTKFDFVDKSLIVWHVKGESSDGTKYVLLEEELLAGDTKTKFLIPKGSEENQNTGSSFLFDFKVNGVWEVYCSLYDEDGSLLGESEKVEISTVIVISSWKIWTIVGSLIFAGFVILAVIIIVAKRKEKIW